MPDIATLVKTYLEPSTKSKRLNYYTVLGLDELAEDRTTIALALDRAVEKLKSADRASDPSGFEQVVKIVRQARAILLDEGKKREYDRQLQASFEKRPVAAAKASSRSGEPDKLAALLPQGDPGAPFSMSEFLSQPAISNASFTETVAERQFAIAELARQETRVGSAVGVAIDSPPQREQQPLLNEPHPHLSPSPASRSSGRELQELIRRKRQKKNRFAAGIAIGGSTLILLIGAGMFFFNQMEQKKRLEQASKSGLASAFQPMAPSVDDVVSNIEPERESPAPPKPRMNLGVEPQAVPENLGSLPSIGGNDLPEPKNPNLAEGVEADSMKPTDDAAKTKMVNDILGPKPATGNDSKWKMSMNAARKMIEERNFEEFNAEIENAHQLANAEQEEKTRRLDKFGQLYQKGVELAIEAVGSLKATEEIRYGTAGGKALIVDVSPERLVLRISGERAEYSFDKIPMGIFMAIVEPRLSDSPMDLAIRAILYSMGPRSNAANKKQAKELFDKAAAADESYANLESVMSEEF